MGLSTTTVIGQSTRKSIFKKFRDCVLTFSSFIAMFSKIINISKNCHLYNSNWMMYNECVRLANRKLK